MKIFVSTPLAALAAIISSTDINAQEEVRDLKAGFGWQSLVVDLDSVTGGSGNIGVQHLMGEIFVTTRNQAGNHFVTVLDGTGMKLRSWDQLALAQTSAWGYRDGATDGQNLAFGFESGIELVSVNGAVVTSLERENGSLSVPTGLIAGNVLDPGNLGLIRALAYNPRGNMGEGSFWVGNFSLSIFEIDTAGDVLTSHPNIGSQWSCYGFGIDPTSNGTRMWINSAPNSSTLAELDLTTGNLTNQTMIEIQGIQGGLGIVPGSLGRGSNAGGYDILHLQQGQPDELRIRRLHLDAAGEGTPPAPETRLGTAEPDLLSSIDDAMVWPLSDRGLLLYDINTASIEMGWDLSRNPGDGMGTGGLNGTLAVIFLNVGPDAAIGSDSTSNLLGVRELVHMQPLLTNLLPQFVVRSRGSILHNDPMLPSPDWHANLVPGVPFQSIGDCIRAQGLYVDAKVPFLPIALTNQTRFCRGPDPIVLAGTYAICLGNNSSNSDIRSGFFQIHNDETDPDLSVVAATWTIRPGDPLNSATTDNLFNTSFRWDTDSPGMADFFEGGNSPMPGCQGTYRNNSAVDTGLIFAGTIQQNATPCDATALQGWVGSDDGLTHYGSLDGDWLTLDFTFTPGSFMNGDVFEFDCDTDGGPGSDGGSMAGVIVTVMFADGTTSTTELISDPMNSARSLGQL